jgi:GDPmannose 4,6-dehydratase
VLLITGGPGQDALILASIAIKAGLEVTITAKSEASMKLGKFLSPSVKWRLLDVGDFASCKRLIRELKPLQLVNFAGVSSVASSWENPVQTHSVNSNGCLNLLEAIRAESPATHYWQAGSSEMFSRELVSVNAKTRFEPASPYGQSKAHAAEWVNFYREKFALKCGNLFLFNHESPLRSEEFVWKVIEKQLVESLRHDESPSIRLANPDSSKDWSWAPDLLLGVLKALSLGDPVDLVFASGRLTSLKAVVQQFGKALDIPSVAIIQTGPARPNDGSHPYGDISSTIELLDWRPTTSLEDAVETMVSFSSFAQAERYAIATKANWLRTLE